MSQQAKKKETTANAAIAASGAAAPNRQHKQHQQQNGNVKTSVAAPPSVNKRRPQRAQLTAKAKTKSKSSTVRSSKDRERAEREALVLWRRPLQTVQYCVLELSALLQSSCKRLLRQRALVAAIILLSIVLGFIYHIPGPHQALIDVGRRNTWFFVYWVGLGVLSSVGLGTGLHTFLLYLGPHIASVTLAAYECNSLAFPQPPYPDEITCPEEPYERRVPNMWAIMSKVRLEAFLWGAGTALGELPPYFMARAARLSGYDPEDAEELAEFKALKAKRNQHDLSLVDRGKLFMERVVERIGFFGILASASIPNPLFDLAGITCGHFLVPFWTFFGATLIGKAVIKMHIQKVFVIIAFNEALIERAVDLLAALPFVGAQLQEPFKVMLRNQKQRLHRNQAQNKGAAASSNLLSTVFESFVVAMVCYFILSIVNSLAQSYHKRLHKQQKQQHSGALSAAVLGRRSKHKTAHD